MIELSNPIVWSLITAIAAGGASWGASKQSLNGTRERVKKVEAEFTSHKAETTDRLARVETKIDILLQRQQENTK